MVIGWNLNRRCESRDTTGRRTQRRLCMAHLARRCAQDVGMAVGDELDVVIEDEICSHVLVNRSDGSGVRVIRASADWPARAVRHSLSKGLKSVNRWTGLARE
jgi:hypothetical protein